MSPNDRSAKLSGRVLHLAGAVLTVHSVAMAQPASGREELPRGPSAAPEGAPGGDTQAPAGEPPPLDLTDWAGRSPKDSSVVGESSAARPTGGASSASSPAVRKTVQSTDEEGAPSSSSARDGFYFRFTTGLNFVSAQGAGPKGGAAVRGMDTGGFSLALGWSVARGVAIAAVIQDFANTSDFVGGPFHDAEIMTRDAGSVEASNMAFADFVQLGLLIDWYPFPSAGLHVGATAGVSVLSVTNNADGSILFGDGFAGGLCGGYDWPIAKRWTLGVELTAVLGNSVSMKNDDKVIASDAGYDLIPFAVGLRGSLAYF